MFAVFNYLMIFTNGYITICLRSGLAKIVHTPAAGIFYGVSIVP